MLLTQALIVALASIPSVVVGEKPHKGEHHQKDIKSVHEWRKHSAEELAPHIAREMLDKSPFLHVTGVDKDTKFPISHLERHISSDNCEAVQFSNNGNPILSLSKLNATYQNWANDKDAKFSVTVEHPPIFGLKIDQVPYMDLFGKLVEIKNDDDSYAKLVHCFKKQKRADANWLNDDDLVFMEYQVDEVSFDGDFGWGIFTGIISHDEYHNADAPHKVPPCPFHRPPHHHDKDGHGPHHHEHNEDDDEEDSIGHQYEKNPQRSFYKNKKHHDDDNDDEWEHKLKKHHGDKPHKSHHKGKKHHGKKHKNSEKLNHKNNKHENEEFTQLSHKNEYQREEFHKGCEESERSLLGLFLHWLNTY